MTPSENTDHPPRELPALSPCDLRDLGDILADCEMSCEAAVTQLCTPPALRAYGWEPFYAVRNLARTLSDTAAQLRGAAEWNKWVAPDPDPEGAPASGPLPWNDDREPLPLTKGAALGFASEGHRVFPLCRKHGPHVDPAEATTDLAQIIEWWTRWPNAGVGVIRHDSPARVVEALLDSLPPREGGDA